MDEVHDTERTTMIGIFVDDGFEGLVEAKDGFYQEIRSTNSGLAVRYSYMLVLRRLWITRTRTMAAIDLLVCYTLSCLANLKWPGQKR